MAFLKSLLTTGGLTAGAAAMGSVASSQGVDDDWYRRLDKPGFQPPAAAFPIVWTTLYADIALTSAGVLSARPRRARLKDDRRGYLAALTVNLVLNASWSWVFFRKHRLALALVVAALLAMSSFDLARRAGRVRRGHGLLLLPYALWCSFATVLTARLAAANS